MVKSGVFPENKLAPKNHSVLDLLFWICYLDLASLLFIFFFSSEDLELTEYEDFF